MPNKTKPTAAKTRPATEKDREYFELRGEYHHAPSWWKGKRVPVSTAARAATKGATKRK